MKLFLLRINNWKKNSSFIRINQIFEKNFNCIYCYTFLMQQGNNSGWYRACACVGVSSSEILFVIIWLVSLRWHYVLIGNTSGCPIKARINQTRIIAAHASVMRLRGNAPHKHSLVQPQLINFLYVHIYEAKLLWSIRFIKLQ